MYSFLYIRNLVSKSLLATSSPPKNNLILKKRFNPKKKIMIGSISGLAAEEKSRHYLKKYENSVLINYNHKPKKKWNIQ